MKALKEWNAVISALENGNQTILLRKGGILETASGFRVESKKFLLYPTMEHQGVTNIKKQYHHFLNKKITSTITAYGEIIAEADISNDTIEKLSKFHIWSDSYIIQRRDWHPEKPLKALFLKTYKIPKITIIKKPEYQGCKSWIDINEEIPEGKQVLSDEIIKSRLDEFKEIIH